MTDEKSSELSAYWRRRVNTLKNSVSKRLSRLKAAKVEIATQIATKIAPEQVIYNNQYKQFALDLYQASQYKASMSAGYVPRREQRLPAERLGVRAIAFYLPQYHPIPENDAWWGKGFTEWTSVTRAVPQFSGHYQPRLPGDFGFYDLRLPEVMQQQVELAKDYGITGFCFHHYWFNGRRLLEKPVADFLANRQLDIEFCLCWANENWSRRWDGSENEVLMPQDHTPEDDIAFIDDLIPAFRDPRYIRVDGKPLLIVYRATLFPDIAATAARWRARVKQHGIDDLYLVAALSFDVDNPTRFGFDAGVEFPPHQINALNITHKQEILNPDFVGKVYDFVDVAATAGKVDPADYIRLKTVMPSWDNTARKLAAGHSFIHSSPSLYASWLDDALAVTMRRPAAERLLFINAWNEWGEGAYLEPDRRYGYANLNATANVLASTYDNAEADRLIEAHNATFSKSSDVAIVLHLYYLDLLPSLANKYLVSASNADFFVSVPYHVTAAALTEIIATFPNVHLLRAANRGRDIQPFLLLLEHLTQLRYRYACKLHSKKSPSRNDGNLWREQLIESLLGASDSVAAVSRVFDSEAEIGVLVPANSVLNLSEPNLHVDNVMWLDRLLDMVGCKSHVGRYDFEFSAGSMFWFRIEALKGLLDLKLGIADFEHETGQLDGTLAHALERLILLLAAERAFVSREIDMGQYAKTGDVSYLRHTPQASPAQLSAVSGPNKSGGEGA